MPRSRSVVAGVAAAAVTAPDLDTLAQPGARPSILITDRNGRTLYEAIDAQGNKHVPVALESIPPACRAATVATEDERFYQHPGVDPLAIARAAWLNLQAGKVVSGASTLTQQLARNLLMTEEERSERTLARKIREALLAWRLERRYSKDELLALYLNTTYYGHYATGIEAASQAYFGVHARELNLAQCALLAGLPQWPAGYNPIENLDGRKAAAGHRAAADGRTGRAEPGSRRTRPARKTCALPATPFPIEAPHFVMYVQSAARRPAARRADRAGRAAGHDDARPGLAERGRGGGATPAGAAPAVRGGAGRAARRELRRGCRSRPASGERGAGRLDPQTGAIRAMVGSPDYFDAAISGAVNAALARRGSPARPSSR